MTQDTKKIMILCRGVPGAGKTTLAEALTEMDSIFCADDFFMVGGEYKWDPKKLFLAHKDCQKRVEKAMLDEKPRIFVCNTFIRASDMKPYMKMAEDNKYSFFSVVVENRHGNKDVHSVPDEKRIEMEKDLKNNLKLI